MKTSVTHTLQFLQFTSIHVTFMPLTYNFVEYVKKYEFCMFLNICFTCEQVFNYPISLIISGMYHVQYKYWIIQISRFINAVLSVWNHLKFE